MRRRAPCEVDSSVTKENRTEWIPSNGIRVRVDFASLIMKDGNIKPSTHCMNTSIQHLRMTIQSSIVYTTKVNKVKKKI